MIESEYRAQRICWAGWEQHLPLSPFENQPFIKSSSIFSYFFGFALFRYEIGSICVMSSEMWKNVACAHTELISHSAESTHGGNEHCFRIKSEIYAKSWSWKKSKRQIKCKNYIQLQHTVNRLNTWIFQTMKPFFLLSVVMTEKHLQFIHFTRASYAILRNYHFNWFLLFSCRCCCVSAF